MDSARLRRHSDWRIAHLRPLLVARDEWRDHRLRLARYDKLQRRRETKAGYEEGAAAAAGGVGSAAAPPAEKRSPLVEKAIKLVTGSKAAAKMDSAQLIHFLEMKGLLPDDVVEVLQATGRWET